MIRLKTQCHAISAYRFVVGHTIEGTLVYDVASGAAESMVTEMTLHVVANVDKLFVQALVLKMIPYFDSGLLTWLYDPLKSYR